MKHHTKTVKLFALTVLKSASLIANLASNNYSKKCFLRLLIESGVDIMWDNGH